MTVVVWYVEGIMDYPGVDHIEVEGEVLYRFNKNGTIGKSNIKGHLRMEVQSDVHPQK